jgi:hypothetical protein
MPVIIALFIAVVALYFFFRVLVSALLILTPFIFMGVYLKLRSSLADIPTLPDSEGFDWPDVRATVTKLVERCQHLVKRRKEVHCEAKSLGIAMTKSGLYDQRKNTGRLLNQQLCEINDTIRSICREIIDAKRSVYSALPNLEKFNSDCHKYVSRVAIFRASEQAASYYFGGAGVGFFGPPVIGGLFKSISFFDWRTDLLGATGAGAVAATGSFFVFRRLGVAKLTAAMAEGVNNIHRWSELYRYWDPDDKTWLEAEFQGANGYEHKIHVEETDAADGSAWHEVLGVEPTASLEEIKSAWKARLKEYHPDRVATLGPKLKALAEEESKTLNAAYEMAMQLKQPPQE